MSIYEIILQRRIIRKFKQQRISNEILEKLVDAARYAPSAMVSSMFLKENSKIFYIIRKQI